MTNTVRSRDHTLPPGRYVYAAEAVAEKIATLTDKLFTLFDKSDKLAKTVREQPRRLNV